MSRRIPPNKVDEIYAAADIVDVVSEFVTLKKRGSNYFGLSPWSNEKTPSFAVSPSKGIFKDFSSGKGGNAVSFLMELEGLTYAEALHQLAKKYGIQIEMEEGPEEPFREDNRESLYILNEFAAKYFTKQLLENEVGKKIALSYFKERGILETTIEEFQLGYAPDEWDAFVKEAQRNQFKEEFIEMTGLAFRSEKDNRLLDRFKGRVMFPIHNHQGKISGFGGRIIGKQENTAKYINSPESEIYNKSKLLYGLWQGRQAIRTKDSCILAEGYMDVISLHQNGIKNAVASSGTALTEDQIRLIKRFTKNIILIYDADKAGINAAMRGVDLLLEQELNVRVLLLPEGQDPDSFVLANGKSGFEEYLNLHSADFIDFKISRLLLEHKLSDPQGKTKIIHETAETIARIVDPVQQSVYTQMAAEKLSTPVEVLEQALEQAQKSKDKFDQRNKRMREQSEARQEKLPETIVVPTERDLQEKEILRLMINYHDRYLTFEGEAIGVMDYILEEMEELTFSMEWLESFRQELIIYWKDKGTPDLNRLINHPIKEISVLASKLVTIPVDEVSENWAHYNIKVPRMDENLEKSVEDAVDHYKMKRIKELLSEINSQKNKTMSPEDEIEFARKQIYINNIKVKLAQKLGTTLTWDI